MSEREIQPPRRRPGRPATGITPHRQVRVGEEWDTAERLALELARHDGTVRTRKGRAGEPEEYGDLAGYITRALARENQRVARDLGRRKPTTMGALP